MMISEQLETALFESGSEVEDVIKSLNTLAKFNHGHWKSEKQARFLLNRLDGSMFKDRAAEAFAHRKGLDGQAFSHMSVLKGFGHRDPSKIRYSGMVFVVDKGGVVYRGKVKVNHPKGGEGLSLDWADVKPTFERKRQPEITVDIHAERRAKIEKNQPDIDLIKSIPGWETKDILTDFLRQLEGGRPLSLKQRFVVQKMVPDKALFGDKTEWKKAFEEFKRLLVPKIYKPLLKEYEDDNKNYKGSDELLDKFAHIWSDKKGETEGEHYNYMVGLYNEAMSEASKWKFEYNHRTSQIHTNALWALYHLFSRGGTPGYGVITFADVKEQMEKALRSKSPSKKALGVVSFVVRAAEGMKDLSPERVIRANNQST